MKRRGPIVVPGSDLRRKITDSEAQTFRDIMLMGVAHVFDLMKPGRRYQTAFAEVFDYLLEQSLSFCRDIGSKNADHIKLLLDEAIEKMREREERRMKRELAQLKKWDDRRRKIAAAAHRIQGSKKQ